MNLETEAEIEAGDTGDQMITFRSGDQEFGADIMMIREIRGTMPTTPLPRTPHYVRGVVNLRGNILPVIDLKAMLGGTRTETTAKSVTVVIKCDERVVGLLVDAVSDIIFVKPEQLQVAPEIGADAEERFFDRVANLDGRLITILNIGALAISVVGDSVSKAA